MWPTHLLLAVWGVWLLTPSAADPALRQGIVLFIACIALGGGAWIAAGRVQPLLCLD